MTNAQRQANFRARIKTRIAQLEAEVARRTLRIYDIGLDEYRDVTQDDVDRMMKKLTELMAPKISPREGAPFEPDWPRLYVGKIEDRGRSATVGILI